MHLVTVAGALLDVSFWRRVLAAFGSRSADDTSRVALGACLPRRRIARRRRTLTPQSFLSVTAGV